jgi:hypothetical protein
MEKEKFFKCPYCFERISMILDLSEGGEHTYIEDCEVCCQPIQLSFSVEDLKLRDFSARAIQ